MVQTTEWTWTIFLCYLINPIHIIHNYLPANGLCVLSIVPHSYPGGSDCSLCWAHWIWLFSSLGFRYLNFFSSTSIFLDACECVLLRLATIKMEWIVVHRRTFLSGCVSLELFPKQDGRKCWQRKYFTCIIMNLFSFITARWRSLRLKFSLSGQYFFWWAGPVGWKEIAGLSDSS